MNMNCSGHSELRDPDWYDPDRSLARARNPIDSDTASRMHNSLASLNVDSLTIAEMNDQSFNHYSVRSLPVVSSTANTVTRIATAPDAPWNESTRSLRAISGIPGVPATNNITAISNVRPSRATKPPPGVSALDHLQNSLSNIMVSAMSSNSGLPHDIVALEDDSEYDSLAADQEDSLNGSFVSLRLADVMNAGNNEMDETAHAGNVNRAHSRTTNHYQTPVSPLRSPMHSSNSYRLAHADSNLNSSYTSARSASSPTRAGSMRHRHYSGGAIQEVPSFSTLDEHTEYYNDGCDLGEDEDDNNVEIIKVLRTQIDTMKHELLKQQEQNQKLIHQYEYKNQMSQFLPMDSIVQNGKGGFFSCGNESFASTRSNFNHSKHNRNVSFEKNTDSVTQSEAFLQQQKQLSEAELGIIGSFAALKASLFKGQSEKENLGTQNSVSKEQQPVSPESDESTNNINDEDNVSISLLDELVVCELEAHVKLFQRISKMQFEALYHQNEQLQAEVSDQATRIMELERQLKEK